MIGKARQLLILVVVSGCATTEPLPTFYTLGPGGDVQSKAKQSTAKSRWVLIDVVVKNQHGEKVATGEAMVVRNLQPSESKK